MSNAKTSVITFDSLTRKLFSRSRKGMTCDNISTHTESIDPNAVYKAKVTRHCQVNCTFQST
jgi:hypothetical protein